jgi:broad specificity phosphatase PhoE
MAMVQTMGPAQRGTRWRTTSRLARQAVRMAREVVLVRHGETEWSASGQHTGVTDIPLSEEGRRQGELLGGLLTRWQFSLALSSPRQRAVDTCRLAGMSCEIDEDLTEWDYGDFEGLTTPEIRERLPGWTVWTGPVPGGEAVEQVAARADRVIARIEAVDGDVVLFSHGHMLRVLAARWMELPAIEGRRLMLHTATVSVLGREHGNRAIRLWNGFPRE